MFESGCVKIELGNVLMDVTPIPRTSFRQDLVALQATKESKHAWWLSEVECRATVTPDLEQLLDGRPVPEWEAGEVPERYAASQVKAARAPHAGMVVPPYRATRRPSREGVVVRLAARFGTLIT